MAFGVEDRDTYPFRLYLDDRHPGEQLRRIHGPLASGWAYAPAKFRNSGRRGRYSIVFVGLAQSRILYYFNGEENRVCEIPYGEVSGASRRGYKVLLKVGTVSYDWKFYRNAVSTVVIELLFQQLRAADNPSRRSSATTASSSSRPAKQAESAPLLRAETHGSQLPPKMIAQRFLERQGIPVRSWRDCPCGIDDLFYISDHLIACPACGRCFTDPDWQPRTRAGTGAAEPVGEEPWEPLYAPESQLVGKTRAWILRPADVQNAPDFLPDGELEAPLRDPT